MVFNSLQFLVFFVVVYALYRSFSHEWQNRLLLVASYVFYGAWDWRFLSLLWASTIIDYFCALAIARQTERRRRRMLLWLSLGFNLSMLGFFKYFNFFAENLHALAAAGGLRLDFVTLRVLLPIGISFYTFMTMSYVIDVYRGDTRPERSLRNFALFVCYFPHLVAGPILRASKLLPQFSSPRVITRDQIQEGLWLIGWGLFKKIFVADNLAHLADAVFAPSAHRRGLEILLAVYAFAFQIYGDFSGYSDIARGTSKLMGIELTVNFRFPYLVLGPREFWRNWHISLSTWLRDYLYIPLGGNRGTAWQTRRNLLITMVLGGLWHGAAWPFVIWGLYQGLLLVADKALDDAGMKSARRSGAFGRFLTWLVMFHLTCYGWLIFRAKSARQIVDLTTGLGHGWSVDSTVLATYAYPLVFYTSLLVAVHLFEARKNDLLAVFRLPPLVRYSVYGAMFYLALLFGDFAGTQFIYFQF